MGLPEKSVFYSIEHVMADLKEIKDNQAAIIAMLSLARPEKKKYLTLADAVEETGYSKAFLYKKTATNHLPCLRPGGGKLLFKREDLEAWIESNGKSGKVRKLKVVK